MRAFFISLTRNAISLAGAALTTVSAILIFTLFAIELFGFVGNPYVGILAYLVLPAFFLLGLALIPIGVVRQRRREKRAKERGEPAPTFPIIDLNHDRTRRLALTFIVLSCVNIVILASVTYKGVEVLDSTEFCGETCHKVMAPELTAYRRSPHARVNCVDCHIGPGADWFVKSKLSGAWQVVSTTLELYPRPIPSPVHDLRPARETCEQCHWPNKFVGDRLQVKTHYAADAANTELKTVLLLRVGGQEGDASHGIHWHVNPEHQVRYRSDESRETIYEVELTDDRGNVKLFLPPDGAPGEDHGVWRVMDCIDCHNRPTHVYRMPEEEVDRALKEGRLSRSLPWLRREGTRVLRAEYASHEEARQGIATEISEFYAANVPDADAETVEQAASYLGQLYALNVFPSMKIDWGTYPDHIGHESSPGCFRCHDDLHATADGEAISQDCSTCHVLLALEEENPEILKTLAEY